MKSDKLLTYLLTPWCRVLLEKLTGLQLVKKFPAFYGTQRFITALTSVRHLSLSWASPIQSTYPHPTSWRSILILSTATVFKMCSFYRQFQNCKHAIPFFKHWNKTLTVKHKPHKTQLCFLHFVTVYSKLL